MKKFSNKILYALVLALAFFTSCVPLKDFVYLQGEASEEQLNIAKPAPYRIQPNDNLFVQVVSDDLSSYFNPGSSERYLTSESAIDISSYKVDANGNLEIPNVGVFNVQGLTVEEIKEQISKNISKDLIDYSIIVRLVNRKISLIGEFNRPGTINFYKDNLTIFEAIGLGGDLTDLANRHKVKVIRNEASQKRIATLDLTNKEVLASEFYYILPNDVIYVEPSHKFYESKGLSLTATILGSFSTLFNIFYIIDRTFVPTNPAE